MSLQVMMLGCIMFIFIISVFLFVLGLVGELVGIWGFFDGNLLLVGGFSSQGVIFIVFFVVNEGVCEFVIVQFVGLIFSRIIGGG